MRPSTLPKTRIIIQSCHRCKRLYASDESIQVREFIGTVVILTAVVNVTTECTAFTSALPRGGSGWFPHRLFVRGLRCAGGEGEDRPERRAA